MPECSPASPRLRLADVFARSVEKVLQSRRFKPGQVRALRRAAVCRTAKLGGHQVVCTACGLVESRYHSCRDRHCPTCRALPQARWIAERERRLLPVGHFHVVFTLPSQLRPMAASSPRLLYELLMKSAGRVLCTLGEEVLGGRIGLTMVLHTWTRELHLHPHVHCIVSSGALATDGSTWTPSRTGYLFPVRRMAAMFRSRMMRGLAAALDRDEVQLPPRVSRAALWKRMHRKKWVVYAKKPFGRVEHLIRYLGRYTHRVAISDRRVVRIDEDGLVFKTRDGNTCRLDDEEFLVRFARHVLPHGFRKIRHCGLYAPSSVPKLLPAARALIQASSATSVESPEPQEEAPLDPLDMLRLLTGFDPRVCRGCGADALKLEPLPRARDGPGVTTER